MAFPAQVFYSILEVSVRWGCSLTQVVNYAIADEIDLVAGVSHVMFGEESVAGLISVPGCAVRPLFPPFGKAAKRQSGKENLRDARPPVVQGSLESDHRTRSWLTADCGRHHDHRQGNRPF